jgi:hypothetical protein
MMKKHIIWVFIIILLFSSQESLAQFERFSIRADIGTGCLPLRDWSDFWGDVQSSYYQKDRFGSYWDVSICYNLNEKHALLFSVGGIRISASMSDVMIFGSPSETTGVAVDVLEWDINAWPLSFSYEFHPVGANNANSPFIGAGVSYFISKLEHKLFAVYDPLYFGLFNEQGVREGKGYGVHAYLGLRSQITSHLYFVSRLRVQYADGMGFTDNKGDIKVEFTGVDLSFGVGCVF